MSVPDIANKDKFSKYFLPFWGTVIILILAGWFFMFTLDQRGHLPPRPISDDLSFDEKVSWLANNFSGKCDILASGSSMTLNNLHSDTISARFGAKKFINISAWGLPMKLNFLWLQHTLQYCTPELVIIVSSMDDFRRSSRPIAFFDPDSVDDVIQKRELVPDYLRFGNIQYVFRNWRRVDDERLSRKKYNSLFYDSNGGIPLSAESFQIIQRRWNNPVSLPRSLVDTKNYSALADIATLLLSVNARFVFVQGPVRRDLVTPANRKNLEAHWSKIAELKRYKNFQFINLFDLENVTDADFVDSTHLNEGGSRKLTKKLIANLSKQP